MESILLVIHALIALLLIIVVLIQRAEGGALGIGGGSDGMSPRGASDALTRTTAILAAIFIVTSITLTIISLKSANRTIIFNEESVEVPVNLEDLPELPQLD